MEPRNEAFDAVGVTVDWIDACRQGRLADLLDSTTRRRRSTAAGAAGSKVELRCNATTLKLQISRSVRADLSAHRLDGGNQLAFALTFLTQHFRLFGHNRQKLTSLHPTRSQQLV